MLVLFSLLVVVACTFILAITVPVIIIVIGKYWLFNYTKKSMCCCWNERGIEYRGFTKNVPETLWLSSCFLSVLRKWIWIYDSPIFVESVSRGALRKNCSENMQKMYRRTPMTNATLLKLHFDSGAFLYKFAVYFQSTFLWEHLWKAVSVS